MSRGSPSAAATRNTTCDPTRPRIRFITVCTSWPFVGTNPPSGRGLIASSRSPGCNLPSWAAAPSSLSIVTTKKPRASWLTMPPMPPISTCASPMGSRLGRGTYSMMASTPSPGTASAAGSTAPCGSQAIAAPRSRPSTRQPFRLASPAINVPTRPGSSLGDGRATSDVSESTSSSGTATSSSMPATRSRSDRSSTEARRPAIVPPLACTNRRVAGAELATAWSRSGRGRTISSISSSPIRTSPAAARTSTSPEALSYDAISPSIVRPSPQTTLVALRTSSTGSSVVHGPTRKLSSDTSPVPSEIRKRPDGSRFAGGTTTSETGPATPRSTV